MQCAWCFPSKRRERKKKTIHKRKMRIHLGMMPQAQMERVFSRTKVVDLQYMLSTRWEGSVSTWITTPTHLCYSLLWRASAPANGLSDQINTNQKNQNTKPYNRLWALFSWKIVVWTNEQRKQSKERFLKKPTCKAKAWVKKSAKCNADFGGRLEIKQNIEKAKRNCCFLNKNSSG